MSISWPSSIDLLDVLGPWLYQQRWFPGTEGQAVRLVANLDLTRWSAPTSPATSAPAHTGADAEGDHDGGLQPVWISFIQVGEAILQIPLSYSPVQPARGEIAKVEDGWLVDGPHDETFLRAWVSYTYQCGGVSPLDPTQAQAVAEDLEEHCAGARVLSGEQSNTSVLFTGQRPCVAKFLRVLHPGAHPEMEMTAALASHGWEHTAAPVLALETTLEQAGWGAQPVLLSLAAQFIDGARDGFELCVERAKAGDEFTGPARALGHTIATMHATLAQAFTPQSHPDGAAVHAQEIFERIHANFAAAATEVPQLRDFANAEGIEAALQQVRDLTELPDAMRIHGDLHLGQTLERDGNWWVLDFEGEPLRPLAVRREPDLALRDVAGMLRSFDYAAARAGANESWLEGVRAAFLDGYTDGHGFNDAEQKLLRALEVEKAAYEAVYEHRLRPEWVMIPLRALAKLSQVQ